jgi:hypothetical protein
MQAAENKQNNKIFQNGFRNSLSVISPCLNFLWGLAMTATMTETATEPSAS